MERIHCERKCSSLKKFLITLFIVGFAMTVICGIGIYAQGEKLSKDNQYNEKVTTNLSKIYKQDIKSIDINAEESYITIKKGSHFTIKSRGDDKNIKVDSTVKNKTWTIKDHTKGSHINFRPQNNDENHITITVPTQLDSLRVKTDVGDLKVSDIKAQSAEYKADSSDVLVKRGHYHHLTTYNDSGDIETEDVGLKKVNLYNDSGDIIMKDMHPDVLTQVKNDSGDIELNYKHDPKNSRFEIHNDSGDTNIDNQFLKHKKVGKGKNLIQLNNDSGDIDIE